MKTIKTKTTTKTKAKTTMAPARDAISGRARELYRVLAGLARDQRAWIGYRELAEMLPEDSRVHHRSPALFRALTEVAQLCLARRLPVVTALVWSATTKRPCDGYYKVAHPRSRSLRAQIAAWELEHERVLRDASRLPVTL